MEVVNQQKHVVNGAITSLFQQWEQQLREKSKEYDLLQEKVIELQDILNAKDYTITWLRNDNTHLREENTRLKLSPGQDDSSRHKALIEKHNNLYREYELQKATAAANQHDLIKQLRKERDKLRSWNRFSSPDPHSPRLPVGAAHDAALHRVDQAERCEARTSLIGGGDCADGRSADRGHIFNCENGKVRAGIEHPPNQSAATESFDDLQGSTDAAHNKAATTNRSITTEQPSKITDPVSSFVDVELPPEPRMASPELPAMPEKRQVSLVTDREVAAGPDTAASQESLPQIRHSDSTSPPSEGSVTIGTEEISIQENPDSDSPEFLGARCVKKKTSNRVSTGGRLPAGSATEPVTIKSDPDTSFTASRPAQLNRFPSSIHESLDPSTSGCEQGSPRKHRPSPILPSAPPNAEPQDTLANSRHPTPHRATSHPLISNGPGYSVYQPSTRLRQDNGYAEQAAPLRQIDGNARRVPRNGEISLSLKSKKRKSDDSRGIEAIPSIAEDGEEFVKRVRKTSKERISSPNLANSSVYQRLGNLLIDHPARKEPLPQISRKTIQEMNECLSSASLAYTLSGKKPFNQLLNSRDKDWEWWDEAKAVLRSHDERSPQMPLGHPTEHKKRRAQILQNATASTPSRPPHPTTPEINPSKPTSPSSARFPASKPPNAHTHTHTPYRSLPLPSLNLTHFKLNPSANHNLTYAYTDVERNQTARKCLPGCTRPQCCGRAFTALAQTLPQPHNPNPTPNHPTSTLRSPTDEAVLQSYLGPSHYSTLTPTERPTHLLAARTAHLANKYGRAHRRLHQRAPSPPGFWNVDFPATQEREEERGVAEGRERVEVERRWRESLKNPAPGQGDGDGDGGRGRGRGEERGVWMFADE